MSTEASLWRYIRDGMGSRWHAQRHEDRLSAGVPDVSFALDGVDGWLELKVLSRWPTRPETPVRLGLRADQALWLRDRAKVGGGRCWVLGQVGRDYMLLPWWRGPAIVAGLTRVQMEGDFRTRVFRGRIPWEVFTEALLGGTRL